MNREALVARLLEEATHDLHHETIQLLTEAAEALAEQPAQQEPVVFYRCNGCGHAYEQVHPTSCDCMEADGFDRVEYYTYPPVQRKPLSNEARENLMKKAWSEWLTMKDDDHSFAWHFLFARHFSFEVEAAHGIKENT